MGLLWVGLARALGWNGRCGGLEAAQGQPRQHQSPVLIGCRMSGVAEAKASSNVPGEPSGRTPGPTFPDEPKVVYLPGTSMLRDWRQRVKAAGESLCVQQHRQVRRSRFGERGQGLASQKDSMGSKNTPFGG